MGGILVLLWWGCLARSTSVFSDSSCFASCVASAFSSAALGCPSMTLINFLISPISWLMAAASCIRMCLSCITASSAWWMTEMAWATSFWAIVSVPLLCSSWWPSPRWVMMYNSSEMRFSKNSKSSSITWTWCTLCSLVAFASEAFRSNASASTSTIWCSIELARWPLPCLYNSARTAFVLVISASARLERASANWRPSWPGVAWANMKVKYLV